MSTDWKRDALEEDDARRAREAAQHDKWSRPEYREATRRLMGGNPSVSA